MSCTGLQPVCVWETDATATLQSTELSYNHKGQRDKLKCLIQDFGAGKTKLLQNSFVFSGVFL